MFGYSENDTIISFLIGLIFGLLLIIIINHLKTNSIYHKIIYFIYLTIMIILGIVIIETYLSYFFLTKTPRMIIILPVILLCIYISFQGKQTINILSNLLLYLSIFFIIITIIIIIPSFSFNNFLPFFSHPLTNILKSSFIFGIFSSSPNILLSNDSIPLKKHLKYYLITSIINIIIGIMIIGILKPTLLSIYSFPEYMVLKNIKLFGFIENLENILSLIWLIDTIFMLSYSFYNLHLLLNKKYLSLSYIIILTIITTYFIITNYDIVLLIYYYGSLVILIIIILLSIKKELFISSEKYK